MFERLQKAQAAERILSAGKSEYYMQFLSIFNLVLTIIAGLLDVAHRGVW
jgi:hypothetical protein